MNSTLAQNISFNDIKSYQNEKVVNRIAKLESVSLVVAKQMFNDLKLFLFIANTSKDVIAPTGKIDSAWHHFLMYTKDYKDFCLKYFGRFIHHNPYETEEQRDNIGKPACLRAITMASKITGNDLSDNWKLCSESGDCSPSYDCDTEGGDNSDPSDWN